MKFQSKSENNKGFILSEMLLSLVVWLILLSTVIPSFLHLTYSRKELLIDHMANSLLTNQAIKLIYHEPVSERIYQNGFPSYTFTVTDQNNGKEICIHYENRKDKKKQTCRIVHD